MLQLHPGLGDEPLKISLSIYELTAKNTKGGKCQPEYDALSYTWGSSANASPIDCNGRSLWVTANVIDALRRLRHVDKERRIWIDQICINQSDMFERQVQIRLMRFIYCASRKVVVWLGRDDANSATAFNMLERITKNHCPDMDISSTQRSSTWQTWQEVQDMGYTTEDWAALNSLFSRPWFTRVWVFQEVVISRPDAQSLTLLCGSWEVSWIKVVQVALWVVNGGRQHCTGLHNVFPAAMMHKYQIWVAQEVDIDIVQLMEET